MTKIAILVRNLYKQHSPKNIIHVFNIHSQSTTKIWGKIFSGGDHAGFAPCKGGGGGIAKIFYTS